MSLNCISIAVLYLSTTTTGHWLNIVAWINSKKNITAGVFVLGKPLQPSIIFAIKARAYLSNWPFRDCYGRLLALPVNIRLGCLDQQWTYLSGASVMKEKRFMVLAQSDLNGSMLLLGIS